jgi:hypothetical protein
LYTKIPFPNTEWWWTCSTVVAREPSGEERTVSIVTNVQLNGSTLGREPSPVAVVAVRDLQNGVTLRQRARGTLSDGPAARFVSPTMRLARCEPDLSSYDEERLAMGLRPSFAPVKNRPGLYCVRVDSSEFLLELNLTEEGMSILGKRGWVEFDPKGPVPLWGTRKLRTYRPSGWLRFEAHGKPWVIVSGAAHFEQQCLLPTASLSSFVGAMAEPRLAIHHFRLLHELELKFHYITARALDSLITVFVLWSVSSGRILSERVTVMWGDAQWEEVTDFEFTPSAYYGCRGVSVPRHVEVAWVGRDGPYRGSCRLSLTHDPSMDWHVPYALGGDLSCMAHEATCTATLRHEDHEPLAIIANQETVDYRKSTSLGGLHV